QGYHLVHVRPGAVEGGEELVGHRAGRREGGRAAGHGGRVVHRYARQRVADRLVGRGVVDHRGRSRRALVDGERLGGACRRVVVGVASEGGGEGVAARPQRPLGARLGAAAGGGGVEGVADLADVGGEAGGSAAEAGGVVGRRAQRHVAVQRDHRA